MIVILTWMSLRLSTCCRLLKPSGKTIPMKIGSTWLALFMVYNIHIYIYIYIYPHFSIFLFHKNWYFQSILYMLIYLFLNGFTDLGKVLLHPSFGELPQWAVVGELCASMMSWSIHSFPFRLRLTVNIIIAIAGDTFPLGCAFDEANVHHKVYFLLKKWHFKCSRYLHKFLKIICVCSISRKTQITTTLITAPRMEFTLKGVV